MRRSPYQPDSSTCALQPYCPYSFRPSKDNGDFCTEYNYVYVFEYTNYPAGKHGYTNRSDLVPIRMEEQIIQYRQQTATFLDMS